MREARVKGVDGCVASVDTFVSDLGNAPVARLAVADLVHDESAGAWFTPKQARRLAAALLRAADAAERGSK